jgi:hypothetical protein
MDRDRNQSPTNQGARPSDTEELTGDTAASEKLTGANRVQPDERRDREGVTDEQNPPRTTRGKFTAPKFGSAGSGGAELEPGPEKD